MIGDFIRRNAFWMLDFLRGSKIRRHFIDIKRIMETDETSRSKIQSKYLFDILKYATDNVEFYKPYKMYSSLNEFPIINKNLMKGSYSAFQSPLYNNKKLYTMFTSGSTGTPFNVQQDADKRNRSFAEMIYFWGRAGYKIGMRYVFFRIFVKGNKKSRLAAFARNVVGINVINLDDENLSKIRSLLKNDRKIKMLLGQASTLENLANNVLDNNDTPDLFGIKTIISIAETLTEPMREKMKAAFGCRVVSLYSNQENGLFAIECNENKEFHINSASCVIEILKIESDEPALPGELGRVVITDLFNRAMPLIRYDIGDLARKKDKADCGWDTLALTQIEGRMGDLFYATDGRALSPHTWYILTWKYKKLRQYQFIQEDAKEYTVKLNGAKGIYSDEDVIETIKSIVGYDAEVNIEHVSSMPVLNSGKHHKTVCKYKPEPEVYKT